MGRIVFTYHSPIPKAWQGTSVPQRVHRDKSSKVDRLPRAGRSKAGLALTPCLTGRPWLALRSAQGPHLFQGQSASEGAYSRMTHWWGADRGAGRPRGCLLSTSPESLWDSPLG